MFSTNHALTYIAVASMSTAGYLAYTGEVTAPAALGLVALIALSARLARAGVRPPSVDLPDRKVVGRVAIVALVLSGSFVAPVGFAIASHNCSDADALIYDMMNVGNWGIDYGGCGTSHVSDVIADMQESDANETEVNLYEGALSMGADATATQTTYRNHLASSETYAWSEARARMNQAIQNNRTENDTLAASQGSVSDYYAAMQLNHIRRWNTTASEMATLDGKQEANPNVSNMFVDLKGAAMPDHTYTAGDTEINGTFTRNVELVNGSTAKIVAVRMIVHNDGSWAEGNWDPVTGWHSTDSYDDSTVEPPTHVHVDRLNDTTPGQKVFNLSSAAETQDRIVTTESRLTANLDQFISGVYDAVENGTYDAAAATESTTLAQEYATQYESTGYWVYAIASLSQLGYATPNLDNAGVMNVSVGQDGTTYQGLVLSQNAPAGGSWETGTTYYPESINGTQFLVTTSGKKIELTEQFVISSMTTKDGEEVNSTETENYNYETINVSQYNKLQEQLTALQTQIENREPTAGGGATGDSGGSILNQLAAFLGVSVGVAGLVLIGGVLLAIKIYTPN